ncbi:hypothetical protein [Chitinilyticum aquatile]|uniref:hypothetical protein n=1 Tax=Chitinilyticum aquatile TaxID=362520 RepID=UPI0004086743|nr:hypothetical protein [Chitinilyticum aquatile]
MKKTLFVILSALPFPLLAAPPLSATLTYESKTLTSDGVLKQTRFQEKLIRSDQAVWTQRLIPKGAPQHNHAEDDHGHKHNLNFALDGKLIDRDAKGTLRLRYVRSEDKTIIEPRPTEYGMMGFDGSWEHAYYLLDRNDLKKMKALDRAAPANSRWYELRNPQRYTLVLWDSRLELPRSIETGNSNGTFSNRITIEPGTAPGTLPWQTLQGYRTIAYEDLLD